MTDIRQDIATKYEAGGTQGQIQLLVRLAHRLTLHARDTYDTDGGVADSAPLRAFNEAEHRIIRELLRLLTEDESRYPDRVFADILIDQFTTLRIDSNEIHAMMSEDTREMDRPKIRRLSVGTIDGTPNTSKHAGANA
jgi:hypothetical protein